MGFRFMETMLRASMPQEAKYLPYALHTEDAWTDDERALIAGRMEKTHPAAVDPMYNTWCFSKFSWSGSAPRYSVRRSTWDMSQWSSEDLAALLDATDLHGGRWTVALLGEVFPDARRITPDEAMALPFAWYKDDPEYQRKHYTTPKALWLVERPHITCLLETHSDPSDPASVVYDEQVRFGR